MPAFKLKNNIIQHNTADEFKIPMKFDISMLNMFIGYIFKKNSVNITRKSLSLMWKLFSIIDTRVYEGDPQLEARITFINNALDAMVVKGFENEDIIINYCRSDIEDKYNTNIIDNISRYTKINYEEIKFINKCVEDRLRHYYLLTYKDEFIKELERLDSGEYRSYSEANERMLQLCTSFVNKSRSAKVLEGQNIFSLSDENFDNNFIDVVNNAKNPKKMLRSGIQKLNEILSPAFIAGRTYIFLGTPGKIATACML